MAKEEKNKANGFKNLKQELKKVVWPTPKQLVNNTVAVITIVLITAVIVFALDFTFEKVNEFGVEKLKSSVKPEEQQVQVTESSEEQSEEPTENSTETVENTENSSEIENNTENNTENNSEQEGNVQDGQNVESQQNNVVE